MQHEPLTFAWMLEHLRTQGVEALEAALADREDDPATREVLGALRLSAHVLREAPEQLAGQLLGRLLGSTTPGAVALLEAAANWRERAWLRPRARNLVAPGGPLVRILSADQFDLSAMCVSADRRRVISGHHTGFVHIWDVESGSLMQSFRAQESAITCIAVTPDGRRLVTGSSEWRILVWDLEREELLTTLRGHTKHYVKALAITADGQRLISGGNDHTVRIWDLDSYELLYILKGHDESVDQVAVTTDGRWLASFGSKTGVLIWDLAAVESGSSQREAPAVSTTPHITDIPDYMPSVEKEVRMTSAAREVLAATTAKMLPIAKPPSLWNASLVFAPNSAKLAITGFHGSVQVWDVATGSHFRTFGTSEKLTSNVGFMQYGTWIVTEEAGEVLVWDFDEHQVIYRSPIIRANSRDLSGVLQEHYVVLEPSARVLWIWDFTRNGNYWPANRCDSVPRQVAVSRDGQWAATGDRSGALRVWNTNRGHVVSDIHVDQHPKAHVAITADGEVFVCPCPLLLMADRQNGSIPDEIEVASDENITALAVTLDGRRIIGGVRKETDNWLRVWDGKSGRVLRNLANKEWVTESIIIAPEGWRALMISNSRQLQMWDLATNEAPRPIGDSNGYVTTAAFASDGNQVVLSSHQDGIKVWDITEEQVVQSLCDPNWPVHLLATLPHGKRIVAINAYSNELRVIDLSNGETVTTFTCDSRCYSCAVAEDGTIVVTDTAGVVHFFDLIEPDRSED